MKKKVMIPVAILMALICLSGWMIWGNTALVRSDYLIKDEKIPAAFNGFRIVHISDLHNAKFGDHNSKLLDMIRRSDPDLIAITGDLIDSRNTNIAVALEFAEQAMKIAPCYYVSGNHESQISDYGQMKEGLQALGVVVLADERAQIEQGGEVIALLGVDDPAFSSVYSHEESATVMSGKLQELRNEEDAYTILLSHRPEFFDVYVRSDLDLVLSGHAHGGQFRLPFIGGVYAPGQGLFPAYDAGVYTENGTNMVVSRGIGNSIFPFRIYNRPELILIELTA